jgi:hypothetical protein
MNTNMYCEKCGVPITHKRNWNRHLLTQTHLRNDPNQTIKPKTRENNLTRKEMLSQAKEFNLKGVSRLKQQQLFDVLSNAKKLLIKTENLEKLKKKKKRTKKHC